MGWGWALVLTALWWAYSGSRWVALLAIFCFLVCTNGNSASRCRYRGRG